MFVHATWVFSFYESHVRPRRQRHVRCLATSVIDADCNDIIRLAKVSLLIGSITLLAIISGPNESILTAVQCESIESYAKENA